MKLFFGPHAIKGASSLLSSLSKPAPDCGLNMLISQELTSANRDVRNNYSEQSSGVGSQRSANTSTLPPQLPWSCTDETMEKRLSYWPSQVT